VARTILRRTHRRPSVQTSDPPHRHRGGQRLVHVSSPTNPAYLHLDEQYCQEHTEFGHRIVNSAFTLGLMVGISVKRNHPRYGDRQFGLGRGSIPEPVVSWRYGSR